MKFLKGGIGDTLRQYLVFSIESKTCKLKDSLILWPKMFWGIGGGKAEPANQTKHHMGIV